jgi:hypothetical protein
MLVLCRIPSHFNRDFTLTLVLQVHHPGVVPSEQDQNVMCCTPTLSSAGMSLSPYISPLRWGYIVRGFLGNLSGDVSTEASIEPVVLLSSIRRPASTPNISMALHCQWQGAVLAYALSA